MGLYKTSFSVPYRDKIKSVNYTLIDRAESLKSEEIGILLCFFLFKVHEFGQGTFSFSLDVSSIYSRSLKKFLTRR